MDITASMDAQIKGQQRLEMVLVSEILINCGLTAQGNPSDIYD